ncbi:hypothetical protein LWU92_21700 [Enterobacter hormaechei]|nr:hypothetical protein [Enterobacter hormaechei]MCE1315774.1 hypothetical protein [Enterobacter hormaechei]QVJ82427.1 hypothetical protein JK004_70 [Cronobacter phage JK004]
MNKKQLAILERAWEADIAHSLKETRYPIFQSKSKVVQQLADDGYLEYVEFNDRGITFKGYRITHLGIMAYCQSLPAEEPTEKDDE